MNRGREMKRVLLGAALGALGGGLYGYLGHCLGST